MWRVSGQVGIAGAVVDDVVHLDMLVGLLRSDDHDLTSVHPHVPIPTESSFRSACEIFVLNSAK